MKFLIHARNALLAFVPDLPLRRLIAAEFISLYSVAKACGLIPGTNLMLAAEIALTLAYLFAIAVDLVDELLRPARSTTGALIRRNPSGLLSRKRDCKLRQERALVTRP